MKTNFKVGDLATFTSFTDSKAGRIIKVSKSGDKVEFQEDEAKLLNGVNSGEPDALTFEAGGFCGHTSGTQRWECKPCITGGRSKFTRRTRKDGSEVWKITGHGTNSPGMTLRPGQHHHYDFNF